MASTIGAASSEVARPTQAAQQTRRADSLEEKEEVPARADAASEDAVVVNIESRVTEEAEADQLAQNLSNSIREGGSESLDAQSEPEPRLVQDLLA